jgi:hypothetical protein
LVAILGTQAVLLLEARTTNGDDQTAAETVIKHTLTARIGIRALAVPLAAEDAGLGCLLKDVDLEAVVLRGEDYHVINAE